jgi:DNA helicase-2/ATP-dependent DNA helicase PcrA
MLGELRQKLAYMTPASLAVLRDWVEAHPGGKDKDRFPIGLKILNKAREVQPPESGPSPLMLKVFAHPLGQEALAGEQCGTWCCEGWKSGNPRFSRLVDEGCRVFAESLTSEEPRLSFQRALMRLLWENRDSAMSLHDWLSSVRREILRELFAGSRTLADESETLDAFVLKTAPSSANEEMTLGQFCGHGEGNNRINLTTLHSSKGREFRLVVMFGMDNGRIPRPNPNERETREARRLFYVGFTRAEEEIHIVCGADNPSRFVNELAERLEE